MPPNPPFPRRGLPSKAPILPRSGAPQPFLKSADGKRMILYLGFLGLAGAMIGGLNLMNAPAKSQAESADSRPESRIVGLTTPPRSYAAPELRHEILTLDDFTPSPRRSAVNITLRWLESAAGPESRPEPLDFTELEIDESVAHPEAFRGGLVKTRGQLLGVDTLGRDDDLTYRGWLVVHVDREDRMVVFETATPPRFEKAAMLEVEGVFLQAVRFEDAKGRSRTAPFLAAGQVSLANVAPPQTLKDKLFTPLLVILIILVLATTLFLVKKSRRSVPASRYVARPPGPGR